VLGAVLDISFGKDLVFMPEPLATFLRTLPWRRQIGRAAASPAPASGSSAAGKPASTSTTSISAVCPSPPQTRNPATRQPQPGPPPVRAAGAGEGAGRHGEHPPQHGRSGGESRRRGVGWLRRAQSENKHLTVRHGAE
jgi:hypothetical protein